MNDAEIAKKNDMLFRLCNRWLFLKNKGKRISDYLAKRKVSQVAVYGCGELGNRLIEELYQSNIHVLVGIDINALHTDAPIEVVLPMTENCKKWEQADAIIVTSVYNYNDVATKMKELGYDKQIIALNDILMDM